MIMIKIKAITDQNKISVVFASILEIKLIKLEISLLVIG